MSIARRQQNVANKVLAGMLSIVNHTSKHWAGYIPADKNEIAKHKKVKRLMTKASRRRNRT